MPVEKFKSLKDAERALLTFNPDKQYYNNLKEFFKLATMLNPVRFPRGIFKYNTLEEADRQKQQWIRENAKKQRGKKTSHL